MPRRKRNESRDKQLNLSLTTAEFENICRRAELIGMRPVHFARAVVLDEKRQVAVAAPTLTNHSRILHQHLARLGNNLNQMMRKLHITGGPMPRDLEPLLADIRTALAGRHEG